MTMRITNSQGKTRRENKLFYFQRVRLDCETGNFAKRGRQNKNHCFTVDVSVLIALVFSRLLDASVNFASVRKYGILILKKKQKWLQDEKMRQKEMEINERERLFCHLKIEV